MASRNFQKNQYCTEVGRTVVDAKLVFAADAEASGLTLSEGAGYFASTAYVRNAEGDWSLVLSDKYKRLLNATFLCSVADTNIQFVSEDVDGSTPKVRVKFITGGSAADPDSGTVYVTLVLKNSVVD